jgi:germination protein M
LLIKKRGAAFSLAVFSLCALTALSGCAGAPGGNGGANANARNVALYFGNAEKTDLSREDVSMPPNQAEPARFALEKLLDGPKNPSNTRLIRAGAVLLDLSVSDGLARVNLSKEFYNEDSVKDVLAIYSILHTLTAFEEVERVKVLVEGEEYIGANGKPFGELKSGDMPSGVAPPHEKSMTLTLYFTDAQSSFLMKEIRRVDAPQSDSVEKLIMNELIKGPKTEGLSRTVPAETKLRSIEVKDGVCFVNLSAEFISKHSGGSAAETMTVYSVVDSLTELSAVNKVQFLIEGEKKESFIHMVFNEPFERDVDLIEG